MKVRRGIYKAIVFSSLSEPGYPSRKLIDNCDQIEVGFIPRKHKLDRLPIIASKEKNNFRFWDISSRPVDHLITDATEQGYTYGWYVSSWPINAILTKIYRVG
jgi:hypothetical protein